MARGLTTEQPRDIAHSRGLSVEQVHRRFIRYRDVNESAFFAPLDISGITAVLPPLPVVVDTAVAQSYNN
jgi:hypothetical protein